MNQTPIIFLDIDGVLVTDECKKIRRKYWYDQRSCPFDPDCVKVLSTILHITFAEIVLSSTWRLFYNLDSLHKIFTFNGLKKSPIAITQELGNRDQEISLFVNEHKIANFLIIDDLDLMAYPERFLQTTSSVGLQKEQIERAVKILDDGSF